jgi:hypothetical protein
MNAIASGRSASHQRLQRKIAARVIGGIKRLSVLIRRDPAAHGQIAGSRVVRQRAGARN